MRPVYDVPEFGPVREITLWKAIVFSILTLGIYYLILTYQSTDDLQRVRDRPFDTWALFFWLGVFLPPLHVVLWVVNLLALDEIRDVLRLRSSGLGIAALILAALLPPIGQLVWAVHFNDSALNQNLCLSSGTYNSNKLQELVESNGFLAIR